MAKPQPRFLLGICAGRTLLFADRFFRIGDRFRQDEVRTSAILLRPGAWSGTIVPTKIRFRQGFPTAKTVFLLFDPMVPTGESWMFTGIIEHLGTVKSLTADRNGGSLTIQAPTVAKNLALSSSIAVNGCCLTVAALNDDRFSADLSGETLRKTAIAEWKS